MPYLLVVLWLGFGIIGWSGCGVKGNPTPYIDVYPEKPPTKPEKAKEGK